MGLSIHIIIIICVLYDELEHFILSPIRGIGFAESGWSNFVYVPYVIEIKKKEKIYNKLIVLLM